MARNLYLDSFGNSVYAAVEEQKKLIEYHVEPLVGKKTVGNIYKGRVENILNGMQAAFVNIGLKKNGYLYVGDMLCDKSEIDGKIDIPAKLNLNIGDEIMVQVIKDANGSKGARITSEISFAGKYIVLLPLISFFGVSHKILEQDVREGLTSYLQKIANKGSGIIARTAAKTATKRQIKKEYEYLFEQYLTAKSSFEKAKCGDILYEDGDLVVRMLRDICNVEMDKIIVGSNWLFQKIKENDYFSSFKKSVELVFYKGARDMFRHFELDRQIISLLSKKVELENGAYLIFDKTEALTVIDVNTGKFTGENDLSQTVYQTNILAAREIARQVRLRNISGIIVVDFIDMESQEHKESVVLELECALKEDRVKCNVLGMSALGLVEFTRKKIRKELAAHIQKYCPYCQGVGMLSADDFTVMRIRTELLDLFADGYINAIIDLNENLAKYILNFGVLSKDVNGVWSGKRIYLVPHKSWQEQAYKIKGDNSFVMDLPKNSLILY